jgi:hypothetical protein
MSKVGCRIVLRRYSTNKLLIISTKISRIVPHIPRICQRFAVPPATSATYPRPGRSLYQRKTQGHCPNPKVVRRILTTAAPRSRIAHERPQTRTTVDVADVRGRLDSFLRQIRPWSPANGVNSEANGLPISDGRELAEFLASSPRPSPRLRGKSPQPRCSVTTITDPQVPAVLTKNPALLTLPPPGCRDSPHNRGAL